MSNIDAYMPLRGYFQDSIYPVECGGPRRQKISRCAGLDLKADEVLASTARHTGLWNVYFIWRGRDELYLYGTSNVGDQEPSGWVERVDPHTLEPILRSAPLPCGGHIWCGGMVAHANGDLYVVNGNHLHRLSPDLEVLAECQLPVDGAFNGLLILSDGRLVTKDLRIDGVGSHLVLIDPDMLQIINALPMAEPSMGRFAIDPGLDADHIYVPGVEHLFLYHYRDGQLTEDSDWRPRYRAAEDNWNGACWDVTIGLGSAWVQDNGDVDNVRNMLASHPVGSVGFTPSLGGTRLGPVRLLRFGLDDPNDSDIVIPTPDVRGWNVAPAVIVPQYDMVISFDTGSAQVVAYRYHGPGHFQRLWDAPLANWWQPIVYPDTAEIVFDDYRFDQMDDNVVIVDLHNGTEKGRVSTGCRAPSAMIPTPSQGRDLYYSSNYGVARIFIADHS
ncbi:MAG: hypothetical protein ACRCY3_08025 [Sphingorhabdus sp.]